MNSKTDILLKDSEKRRAAFRLILLFGVVSALGDIVYESARGVSGPFLLSLGAGAAAIGFVSGLGEFLGYGLRLVSGVLADRLRAYWAAVFIGYGLLLSIPLLGFAYGWEVAAFLLVLERIGKAIRSPSRDTLLSYATKHTGRGWGFAVHEALDQVGAVIGPLLFAAVFASRNDYRLGFLMLGVPALLTVVVLTAAWIIFRRPEELEEVVQADTGCSQQDSKGFPRIFWLYAVFTFFSVMGFASFPVISYHWVRSGLVNAGEVAVLYAFAMGIDAVVALIAGKTYDKIGLKVLVAIPVLSVLIPLAAFTPNFVLVVAGVVIWGGVMALHETIMRAAVADLAAVKRRATAYGYFNVVYGAGWFAGSFCLGLLYDISLPWAVVFILAVESIAFVLFLAMRKHVARVD